MELYRKKIFTIVFTIVSKLLDKFFYFNFKRIRNYYYDNILICDIDNTLAFRSNKYLNSFNSEEILSMLANSGLISWIIENKFDRIIFLSARPFYSYNSTKNWLRKNGFLDVHFQLILTNNALDKIKYVEHFSKSGNIVTYIDDLSFYDTEGNLKLFSNVISAVEKLNINYKNIQFINKFFENE